jgi:DNA-binding LacI/PurR family transcriptional regulator
MNLEEVARRAGVSTATVSRVLNNIDVVRDATRARVMEAAAELNYHPNLNARTLAGGKSRTFGMIASNLENPFFFDIFRSLERESHRAGYDVVVAHTGYDADQLVRSVRLMIGRRVSGLAVIVSEMNPELMRALDHAGIRCVFYDVGAPGRHITNIRVNYRLGIQRLVDYLHELGHRRFAYLGHHSALAPTSEREAAFVATVAKYAPGVEWRTVAGEDSLEGGRQAARALLESGFAPTALVCVNDFTAAGALRELRSRGLRIPADISLSEFCHPALTTVHIPREEIGRLVCETLLASASASKVEGREIRIDPELVLRDSTGRCPDA